MITRQEYVSGTASHEEYYGQFINQSVIMLVKARIGEQRIINSTDDSFNDIPLHEWDKLHHQIFCLVRQPLLKADPSGNCLGSTGCVAKEAARQIRKLAIEESSVKDFEQKMYLYKTAFSPLHNQFVSIKKVRRDDRGELLLDVEMNGRSFVFRPCELEQFVL